MICPVCRTDVPDNRLICEACVHRKAREDMLRHQEQYVAQVLDHKRALKLAIHAKTRPHILLFGDEHRSFCYEHIPTPKRRFEVYDDELFSRVCLKCAEAFKQVVAAEATRRAVTGR